MTSVIEFSKWQREAKSPSTLFGPGQLIMFSGVRVERLDAEISSEVFAAPLKSSKTSA